MVIEFFLWSVLAIVIGLALLAPLESLRWWTHKGEAQVRDAFLVAPGADDDDAAAPGAPTQFAVYLSGVSEISGDRLHEREVDFVARLEEAVPGLAVVADVFPYSESNRGLTQRASVWLWGTLDRMRARWEANPIPFLIQWRNVSHVLVSADPRYGPVSNVGLAHEVWRALQRRGYRPGSGAPVTIIGYSGGGQMGLGAGWFLAGLGVPVSLISIAGVFGADPGLDRMGHVWDLYGTRDKVRLMGPLAFPQRWATAPHSRWARARREGRVTQYELGPMKHDGPDAYFGRNSKVSDGRDYADVTLDAVAEILRTGEVPAAPTPAPAAPPAN